MNELYHCETCDLYLRQFGEDACPSCLRDLAADGSEPAAASEAPDATDADIEPERLRERLRTDLIVWAAPHDVFAPDAFASNVGQTYYLDGWVPVLLTAAVVAPDGRSVKLTVDTTHLHREQDGDGCLTAPDAGFPALTDEPGRRHVCACGRRWVLREVVGFVTWQQDTGRG